MIGPHEQTPPPPRIDEVFVLGGPPPPLDREFKPTELSAVFNHAGISVGRCFGSTSGYRRLFPKHVFIPNANVFCRQHGKIWWGDLDLQRDQPALEKVARKLRCRLYVLRESDGRFENASLPHETVIRRAQWHTGGPTRVLHAARFLQRSGLSPTQLVLLARVRPSCLSRRLRPALAIQVYRRLAEYDEIFSPIAADLGHKKWGDWWTAPNAK